MDRQSEFDLEGAAILFQAIFEHRLVSRESFFESKNPNRIDCHLRECRRLLASERWFVGISGDSPDGFQMGAREESPQWLVGRAREV